jgi:hypothetical protein
MTTGEDTSTGCSSSEEAARYEVLAGAPLRHGPLHVQLEAVHAGWSGFGLTSQWTEAHYRVTAKVGTTTYACRYQRFEDAEAHFKRITQKQHAFD